MEYAILFLPLIGALLGYLIKVFGDIYSEIVTTLFVSGSAILSIILFYNGIVYEDYGNYKIYQWIASGKFVVNASINIDPLSIIIDLRRYLVMEESKVPSELAGMLTNIENNGAPWQFAQADRLKWAEE